MTNFAFAGATSWDVLNQLATSSAQNAIRRSNTALVMIGANDFNRAFNRVLAGKQSSTTAFPPVADQVQRNVMSAVQKIQRLHRGIRVIVAGYWNVEKDGTVGLRTYGSWGERKALEATLDCDAALRSVVAATRSHYVSTFTPFKGYYGTLDPTRFLAWDGDHPNAAGHAAIANSFYENSPWG